MTEAGERLVATLAALGRCAIAFSGGVDSAVVAAAAVRADRQRGRPGESVAVTAVSPAVPQSQLEIASRVAAELGIDHELISSDELARSDYAANGVRRCFFCKQSLYLAIGQVIARRGEMAIVSGTNADDLGDYRPGIEAGQQAGVTTPLADLGIGKSLVRQLANHWAVSVAELPAAPCLASRIAYGVPVTAQRLRQIELAEAWLSQRGFSPLRVRLHDGELARIEVDRKELGRLVAEPLGGELRRHFAELGFRAVTVDLDGFRSGSLNQLVEIRSREPRR